VLSRWRLFLHTTCTYERMQTFLSLEYRWRKSWAWHTAYQLWCGDPPPPPHTTVHLHNTRPTTTTTNVYPHSTTVASSSTNTTFAHRPAHTHTCTTAITHARSCSCCCRSRIYYTRVWPLSSITIFNPIPGRSGRADTQRNNQLSRQGRVWGTHERPTQRVLRRGSGDSADEMLRVQLANSPHRCWAMVRNSPLLPPVSNVLLGNSLTNVDVSAPSRRNSNTFTQYNPSSCTNCLFYCGRIEWCYECYHSDHYVVELTFALYFHPLSTPGSGMISFTTFSTTTAMLRCVFVHSSSSRSFAWLTLMLRWRPRERCVLS
jgi:hypothetical protein